MEINAKKALIKKKYRIQEHKTVKGKNANEHSISTEIFLKLCSLRAFKTKKKQGVFKVIFENFSFDTRKTLLKNFFYIKIISS